MSNVRRHLIERVSVVILRDVSDAMDWVPVVFIMFKAIVLGAGMIFAIKWHYDQDKKAQKGEVLGAVGKITAVLLLSLVGLLFATFMLARTLGLDISVPR